MWYRGRLTPNSVKVFVVGQEGAQDENVSNRSLLVLPEPECKSCSTILVSIDHIYS